MEKTFKTILCAALFTVLAVSCQKEIDYVEPVASTKGTIELRINGLMGEYTQVDATKSSLVNNVRVSWEAGDIVYVYDGTKCLGSLVASLDGDEDRYALLSTDDTHTVAIPADGTTKLTLVHSPLLNEAPKVVDGVISISLAEQNGEKTPFVAYATLEYNNEESITNAIVPFLFATSVIKVNCTGLAANTAIDNATLNNVNTECKLTISGTGAPTVSGDVKGIITKTGDEYFAASKVNADGEAVFQIAVPALEAVSEARVLTVAQGSDKLEDNNFSNKDIAAAKSVNTVCQLVNTRTAGTLPGVFTVSNDDGATKTQIYFSQGNLYFDGGKFNFEANQYDTTPASDGYRNTDHISHFYWSKDARVAYSENYENANTTYGITPDKNDVFFTNADGFKVNVDGKYLTGWRTLSTKEWQYLFNTPGRMVNGKPCYSDAVSGVSIESVTYYGTFVYPDNYYGDKVSDNSMTWEQIKAAGIVFLPAAGHRFSSFVDDVGDYGLYWSSTAFYESDAYAVFFKSDYVKPDHYDDRSYGHSVRLVKDVAE